MKYKNTLRYISIILVALGVVFLLIMGFVSSLKPYVELIFSALIFFVTAVYVMLTSEILNDSQSSREITFIERRLEKFYYPLQAYMNSHTFPSNYEDLGTMFKCQYLATEKTRNLFLEYHNLNSKRSELDITKEKLKESVNSDINMLIRDLNQLTE